MLKHRTLHVAINSQCSVKSNSQRNTCSYQVYSMNLDNDNFAMLFLFVNLFIFRSLQELSFKGIHWDETKKYGMKNEYKCNLFMLIF